MNRALPILKNTAANYVQQIISVIVFMGLTPYAARMLGTEQFGLWSLMWAMVGLLGLADLGISSAVVKFIADAKGKQSDDRIRHLYSTFFWVQSSLALIVLLLAFTITPFLGRIFDIPNQLLRIASVVFLLLSFRVATGMPFGLFVGLLAGHRKQAYSSLIKAGGILIYGLLVFSLLKFRPTATALAWCNLTAHLVSNAVIIAVARRAVPGFTIRPSLFSRSLVKEISSFSGAAILVQISSLLYTRVDIFIVQRFLALTRVAHYSVAMQTIERGSLFCRQLTKALTPLIAEMKGANDDQSIRLILRKGTKLNTALTTPLLGGVIWLAPDLIHSWMGPEFTASILPMRLLAVVAWITAVCEISSTTLTMTGHQKQTARLIVAGQLLNLGLTLLLVRRFGINGVAGASLIAGIATGIITLGFTSKKLHASIWRTYSPVLASALPLGLMFMTIAGIQWASRAAGLDEPSLLLVVFEEGVGCLVFFAAFYWLGFSAKERGYYRSKALALLPRRTKRSL